MAARDDEPQHQYDVCNKPFRVWMLVCNFAYLILAIVTAIIGRFHLHLIAIPPVFLSAILAVCCLVRTKKERDHEPEDSSNGVPKKRGCCGCRSKGKKRGRFQRKLAIVDCLLASWFLAVMIPEWIALSTARRNIMKDLVSFVTMPQLVNMILHLLCCCRGLGCDLSAWAVSCFPLRRDHCPACGHRPDDDNIRDPTLGIRRTRHHYLRDGRSGYAILVEDDSTAGDRTPTGRPASPQYQYRYRDEPHIPIYTPSASSGTLPPPPPQAQSDEPQKMGHQDGRASSMLSGSSAWSRPSLRTESSSDGDGMLPPYRAERSSEEGP